MGDYVAVDLATNFTTWPSRAVNVHIGRTGAHRLNELVDFTGIHALVPRGQSRRDIGTNVRR